jgi:hypothetical protein
MVCTPEWLNREVNEFALMNSLLSFNLLLRVVQPSRIKAFVGHRQIQQFKGKRYSIFKANS